MILHPCQQIYKAAGLTPPNNGVYGICRITGAESYGVSAMEWLKSKGKFNDHNSLLPGSIISHEALFCFDEQSQLLAEKTGRDKPQRFRTYCHIIDEAGTWYALTKADKALMFNIISESNPQLVCLTDTGQKHLLFKHRSGFWQLDDTHIPPNPKELKRLHEAMMNLLKLGFSQTEVQTGRYYPAKVASIGLNTWKEAEMPIKDLRKYPIFDFAAWLMFNYNKN